MNDRIYALKFAQRYSFLRGKTLILTGVAVMMAFGTVSFAFYTRTAATQEVDKKMPTLNGDAAIDNLKKEATNGSLADAITQATPDLSPEAQTKLMRGGRGDLFGSSVAITGNTVIVGARNWPALEPNLARGTAYVFVNGGFSQQLTASDGAIRNFFGDNIAVSGDTAIIGAPGDGGPGAAYIFVRNGGVWTEQQKLTLGAGTVSFGRSVAISGNTAVIGGGDTVFGWHSASVFTRNGSVWTEQQRLPGQGHGISVAISGETLIAGLFVFVRNGTTWTEQHRLTPTNPGLPSILLLSVAITGNTAFIGAPSSGGGSAGVVYVFKRIGTVWTQQQVLVAPDPSANARFGFSVAVSAEALVVGAPFDIGGQGSAYVFYHCDDQWTFQQKVVAFDAGNEFPGGFNEDEFGHSVAISDDNLIIGAWTEDANLGQNVEDRDHGAAYLMPRGDLPPIECEAELEVNISTDEPDADVNDGVCDVDLTEPGQQCSLRAAIQTANANPGPDVITFNIPGGGFQTIMPLEALPPITEKVTIDATTQAGYVSTPYILLRGSGQNYGFYLAPGSNGSVISGFAINRFQAAIAIQSSGNRIEENFIGLGPGGHPNGTVAEHLIGIDIRGAAATNNTIGGAGNLRNVISNNTIGVAISEGATGNKVFGNRIGTYDAGTVPIPNLSGVIISGANNNQIGNGTPERVNIISGNTGNGIEIDQATGNTVKGNKIGVSQAETALGNGGHGIVVRDSPGTTIGGAGSNEGNLIGDNDGSGILVESSPGALRRLGASEPTVIKGNNIGVTLNQMTGNIVRMGNAVAGVLARATADIQIGGTEPGEGNAIGANAGPGVEMTDAERVEMFGNLLGSMRNLQGQLLNGGGNDGDGVRVIDAGPGIQIGSAAAGIVNTIVNNGGSGILVESSPGAPRRRGPGQPVVIKGNNIGVTLNQMTGNIVRMGNAVAGVLARATADIQIGGTEPGAGNAIGANGGPGVEMTDAERVEMFGNLLGSMRDLQGQLLNGGGNGGDGVRVTNGGAGIQIGSAAAGIVNTIVNNGGSGILIESSPGAPKRRGPGEPKLIKGNQIGVTLNDAGTSLVSIGNALSGILIKNTANVQIGGETEDEANLIGNNGLSGIAAEDSPDGLISRNTIVNNSSHGIYLVRSGGMVFKFNEIGVARQFAAPLSHGNGGDGITAEDSEDLLIGDSNAGNVIAGNQGDGIKLVRARLSKVHSNLVGLYELKAAYHRLGNGKNGVVFIDSDNCEIGDIDDLRSNIIAANTEYGILMDEVTQLIKVKNNLTGTAIRNIGGRIDGEPTETDTNFGNGFGGIRISTGSNSNLIGGPEPNARNFIANNGGPGVWIDQTGGVGNWVHQNAIYANSGRGIELGPIGLNPNDPADEDVGPNNLQNYPDIVSLSLNESGELIVSYQVDSAPEHATYGTTGLYVEFFEADPSGAGHVLLGTDHYLLSDYTNGLPGTRVKNLGDPATLGLQKGEQLTMSVTDAAGNTSEFAPAIDGPFPPGTPTPTPTPSPTPTATPNTPPGMDVTITSPASDATVTFPEVTTPGETTFVLIDPPSSAGTPPAGYEILEEGPAYDITTTADFSGEVTVCYIVASINDSEIFARVRILHGEGGMLVDRTVLPPHTPAPSFPDRRVCARINGLSPFVTALAPEGVTPTPTPTPGGGIEGDLASRPNGDGNLLSNDVTLARQFVVGLLIPTEGTNEFQRADTAPLATRGDGILTAGDVTQIRRYVAGIDALNAAGGPTGSPMRAESDSSNGGGIVEDIYSYFFGREIRVAAGSNG